MKKSFRVSGPKGCVSPVGTKREAGIGGPLNFVPGLAVAFSEWWIAIGARVGTSGASNSEWKPQQAGSFCTPRT